MADSPRPRIEPPPPGAVQAGPHVARCPAGKYAHCQCRRSRDYPLCDGSHRGSGVHPIKIVFDEERTVAWCACGGSSDMPFCDGSHRGRRGR